MTGVNKVIIMGNLGADPQLKTVRGGREVATFSVATSDYWTDKDGQKQEKTEWHKIVVWGRLASLCAERLSKGSKVYIEGKNQTRYWEDSEGVKRNVTEVVAKDVQFVDKKRVQSSQNDTDDWGPEPSFDSSEEIPF